MTTQQQNSPLNQQQQSQQNNLEQQLEEITREEKTYDSWEHSFMTQQQNSFQDQNLTLNESQVFAQPVNYFKYIEPETHTKNKGCIEKCRQYCCYCCCPVNYDLTKREITAFQNLKMLCSISFDIYDVDHGKLLRNLYDILTEKELPETQVEAEEWVTFGFQSKNPVSDFRGAGLQGVKDLIYYSNRNFDTVLEMAKPENNFFFACSSINLTFFLKKYFHFASFLDAKTDRDQYCSRKSLKRFCQFLVDDEEVLYYIHEMLLTDLFENCWLGLIKNRRKAQKETSIMDFGIALNALKIKFKKALDSRSHFQDFESFRQFFLQQNTVFDENCMSHQ